jgi:predicted ATPase
MIDRLIIENFKSIRKLELTLNPINVLIGSNGAGKSNFIGFLKLLNQIFEKNLQTYIAQSGGANNMLYFGLKHSNHLLGTIFFKNVYNQTTNKYEFSLLPAESNSLFFSFEDVGYNSTYTKNIETWLNNLYKGNTKETLVLYFNGYRYDFIRGYFANFKIYHFHDTGSTALIKQPCNINDNKILKEDGSNLAAFLYLLQEKHPKDFKRIEAVVRSIAPFFDRFDLEPNRLNEQFIQLEWKEKGAPDMYLNAFNLSDGTLRMIALTTLLMQPNPPKTIIIDEPELGLHPFAINKLASLIKIASTNSQIIVSTQSTNLISNFTPEDIITVDRQENQSVFKRLNSDDLENWLSDYSLGEIWEKNLIGGRP